MRGNIKKQLSSVALLVLLLVAISVPAMATDSGEGVTGPAGDYAPSDASVDPGYVPDAPTDDGGLVVDLPEDAMVVSADDGLADGEPVDEGVEVPAADDETYYATAYGANCHWAPGTTTACTEQNHASDSCAAATNNSTSVSRNSCASKASCPSAIKANSTCT